MDANDSSPEKKSNLDAFFEMFDWVDEDISELNCDDENEVGGYECVFIAFNNLRSYCKQISLDFKQIEDQYQAAGSPTSGSPEQSDKSFWNYDQDATFSEMNELAGFSKLLEVIEKSFLEYEKRCEKSGDIFDEWNCVLIMFSFLRKYCEKLKINYTQLQSDISALHPEIE